MREIADVKEIQNILFDSLCYFDDFCRKHGIKYYIANGTLLGAAKYRGFVPWDDDADVLIPREDYDKLVSLPEINNGKYKLLCKEQVNEWRMPYAKLSCEETYIKEGDYNFGVEFGLSLDIFPIDKWSAHLPFARLEAYRCEMLKRLLICSIGGDFKTKKSGVKKLILKCIWRYGKMKGHEKILKKINRVIAKSRKRKEKYLGCLAWTCHLDKEIFTPDLYEKTTELEFCGRPFPTFLDYERYLDSLYGRWREELPPDKQHSNHDVKVWYRDER